MNPFPICFSEMVEFAGHRGYAVQVYQGTHRKDGLRKGVTMDALRRVKFLHTVVWAFFVACILAIPLFTVLSRFRLAALFAAIVALEVVVLLLNGLTCPLTGVAAKYTRDRQANFDIYLPEWLARNNKIIFGSLYVIALIFLLMRWVTTLQTGN